MISILALVLRLLLLAVFTFGFVVLFDHGPENYLAHARADAQACGQWAGRQLGWGTPLPPSSAPAATPETPSASPSDWKKPSNQSMDGETTPGSAPQPGEESTP